ncbi:hypothetical protein PV326_012517, partial [Microctonus aethiopoides]
HVFSYTHGVDDEANIVDEENIAQYDDLDINDHSSNHSTDNDEDGDNDSDDSELSVRNEDESDSDEDSYISFDEDEQDDPDENIRGDAVKDSDIYNNQPY